MKRERNHWVQYLPDCRPTMHVLSLIAQVHETREQIELLTQRESEIESQIEKRALSEYSPEEVAKAMEDCEAALFESDVPQSEFRIPQRRRAA